MFWIASGVFNYPALANRLGHLFNLKGDYQIQKESPKSNYEIDFEDWIGYSVACLLLLIKDYLFMEKWSIKFNSCRNCDTKRFSHKGHGYCSRCYRLNRKLKRVNAWVFEDKLTWKELPSSVSQTLNNKSTFLKIQKGFIKQINDRLYLLKVWEERRNGNLDALNLEHELRHLAKEAGAKNGWYLHSHYANYLRSTFSKEQRVELYKLLNDIRQAKPWKGINWYKLFDD